MKTRDHRQSFQAELLGGRLVGAATVAFDFGMGAKRLTFDIAA